MIFARALESLAKVQLQLEVPSDVERFVRYEDKSYFLLSLGEDNDTGGEAVVEVSDNGDHRVVALDSFVDPDIEVEEGVSLQSIGIKQPYSGDPPDLPPSPHVPPGTKNDMVGFVAEHFIGILSSKKVPDTKNGQLACAWSTNYVIRVALGEGLGPTQKMLSTINMFKVLDQGKGRRIDMAEAGRGDIVISPTASKARVGHVGILIDSETIANNSSRRGLWLGHKTKTSWRDYYVVNLRLPMVAFRLI